LNVSARADGGVGTSQLLKVCAELTKSEAWQVRSTALGVLGVVYALNQFSLTGPEKNEILQRVLQALTDAKEEIAEQARTLLIAFIHSMPPTYLKQWIEARIRIARQYVGRRDQGTAPSIEYLTSVQILCSVIRAFPYDMPTFMPSVLSAVVRHSSAPAPIGKIVSKTIQDFKRTHQDRWDDVKLFFTAEQLEDLNDAAPTQNYFV
jgi:proteasome activator subunit 4